jgi:hypothetical protein
MTCRLTAHSTKHRPPLYLTAVVRTRPACRLVRPPTETRVRDNQARVRRVRKPLLEPSTLLGSRRLADLPLGVESRLRPRPGPRLKLALLVGLRVGVGLTIEVLLALKPGPAGLGGRGGVRWCGGGSLGAGGFGGRSVRVTGRMGRRIPRWMGWRIRIRWLGRSCWTS